MFFGGRVFEKLAGWDHVLDGFAPMYPPFSAFSSTSVQRFGRNGEPSSRSMTPLVRVGSAAHRAQILQGKTTLEALFEEAISLRPGARHSPRDALLRDGSQ